MNNRLYGMKDEIAVGDKVETNLGVGKVVRVVAPVREIDHAMLEIDLGKKWVDIEQVRSIVVKAERHPTREEPEMGWDEHE